MSSMIRVMITNKYKAYSFQYEEKEKEIVFPEECKQRSHNALFFCGKCPHYLIKNVNLSKFLRAIPVPLATALKGSSAICMGSFVL